ncbi:MAG: translocation/assembly module TamB domain-containing protein [Candidatus Eremiobacteraeota bacterium]|nr:translocation/assembly module TamB domain-containing protein [Candidatus Eremiobacteraeota bacterium]
MRGKKRFWALIAALAVVFTVLAINHHPVGRFLMTQTLSLASGYHVEIGEMRLQSDHGAFIGTHVSKHGEPVLDAERIDIYYHLRDLLPGSRHRFGFVGLSINKPHLTIIHHKDGTYNIGQSISPGAAHGAPGQTQPIGTPLDFTVRVRDGSATLLDEYQYYKEARVQAIHHINADATVNSDTRTHYTVTAAFVDLKDQPIRAVGTIDYVHGYALHHVYAAAVPIEAIGNYVINSPAARIVAGTAKDFDARMYSLNVSPGKPIEYHTAATLHFSDGQLYINGLAKPLDGISGGLQITDSGLSARSLAASIAGVPITVAGSIYNFSDPKFYLGLQGAGDLRALKNIVANGSTYPLSGDTHFDTLIEGPIANPLIMFGFASPELQYAAYPLANAHGLLALYNNIASIVPLRGRYGTINLAVRGDLSLGSHVQSEIAIGYSANANDLPYLGSLTPGSVISGQAIAQGTDSALGIDGYIADENHPARFNAFYGMSPQGLGSVGPLAVERNGGTLYGGFTMDRAHNDSSFWLSARDFALAPARAVALPGAQLPQVAQLDGHVLDADVAGAGSATDLALGGRVHARDLQVAGVRLDNFGIAFAGPLANLSISEIHANGPWGVFDGNGSYANGGVVANGNFDGNLDSLPYASSVGAHGSVHGPVALAYQGDRVILQTHGARFTNVSVQGIAIQSLDGTIGIGKDGTRVYAAQAQVAGANAVAAGTFGQSGDSMAVATADAGPQAARALGLPLESGRVAMVGTVGQQGNAPTFDGGVAISNGRAAGYPVQGSSELHVSADALSVQDATLTMDGMYGAVAGNVRALRSGSPTYDLSAHVPAGDIARAAQTLHLSTFGLVVGSFGADLQIGGRGASPTIRGPIGVPIGKINGMGFDGAHTIIAADAGGVSAQQGDVMVQTTRAGFHGFLRGSSTSIAVRAPNADLSDFNDFFDTGDTLAGKGRVVFAASRARNLIASSGDIDVKDFRYRRLPIGDTDADWSSRNGTVTGSVHVGGVHGTMAMSGNVGIASSAMMGEIVARSHYNVRAKLRGLDLSTWLPAFGYPTVPLTGRVDADATVVGRYPHLVLASEATIRQGTLGRVPIDLLHMVARSQGSRIALTHLDVEVPALIASGSGLFGLSPRDPIQFTMRAESTDIPTLASNFVKTPLGVRGSLETELSVGGTWRAPQLNAGINLTNATVRGLAVPQLVASLGLRGSNLLVRNAELTLTKGRVAVAGALPLQLTPFGIGPPSAPLSMDFFSSGADLSNFNPLLPKGTVIGGVLDGHIGLHGTVRAPQIRGAIALANGSYVSPIETTAITQTVARMVFEGTSARLQMLHAQLGRGALDADGKIAFNGGASGDQVVFHADATTHGAMLSFPAYGSGTLDSKVHLTKEPGALALLSGDASITNAVIPVAALVPQSGAAGSDAAAASPAPGFPFNVAFNLGITAGKNVAVRANALGFAVDIGAKGRAVLAGTLTQPTLDGAFDSSGGTLAFVDHVFKIQQGSVTFNPANGVVPNLSAVATTHVTNPDPDPARNPTGAADITVKVSGLATNANLTFQSDPPGYSRDQIIGLLSPLGAITGIQFDESGNPLAPGQLAGAPPVGNFQPLPPGAYRRQNGTLSVGQEAFNILNARLLSGFLTPIEKALSGTLGLSSVNLTLNYSGTVGLSLRRPLSKRLSAVYARTFGFPDRQTYGFQYAPTEFTVGQLTFFQQNSASFFSNGTTPLTTNPNITVGQPIAGASGFTFTISRLFW